MRIAEVVSEVTVGVDHAELVYVQPHMHLRGKDYELRAIYPTGETQEIFKGKWNFDWQVGYELEKPLAMPKGTRLVAIAHYDNSLNNKYNPDPTKESIGATRTGTKCSPGSWAWWWIGTPTSPRSSSRRGPACCRAENRARRWLPHLG